MKPQIQAPSALGRVVELVRDLRKRCSWDAAQTRETLRPYLVEEVLELDQSIGAGDLKEIRDELGDLMLHLAFQIVIGEETGAFGAEDVTQAIEQKMWRRHPHLFPEKAAPNAGEGVTHAPGSWERLKSRERPAHRPGVLDGLPPSLPALIMAARLQERAAGVGFDWPDAQGPLEKVHEELGEMEQELRTLGHPTGTAPALPASPARPAGPAPALEHEIGDLLFAVVNVARKTGCDARAALEKANARFLERFRRIETLAAERKIDVASAGLEALDKLWDEAKRDLT